MKVRQERRGAEGEAGLRCRLLCSFCALTLCFSCSAPLAGVRFVDDEESVASSPAEAQGGCISLGAQAGGGLPSAGVADA